MIVKLGPVYTPGSPGGVHFERKEAEGHLLDIADKAKTDAYPVFCLYCKQTWTGKVVDLETKGEVTSGFVAVDINNPCPEGETIKDYTKINELVGC